MKTEKTYLHLIRQLAFVCVVLLIAVKPMVSLINHLSNNDDDIELIEDFDEEDSEEEIEFDETLCCTNFFIFSDELKLTDNGTSLYIINQYIDVYKDILIPPPKLQS